MLRYRPTLPNHRGVYAYKTPAMEQALIANKNLQKRRKSLLWGIINILLLVAFIFDLSYKCPVYTTWFNYFEYMAVTTFTFNTFYHLVRYIYFSIKTEVITESESKVSVKSMDINLKLPETMKAPISPGTPNTFDTSLYCTPFNWSATSWKSDRSTNDSQNVSVASPSWIYYHGSPEHFPSMPSTNCGTQTMFFPDTSGVDFITDNKTLQTYLNDYDQYEKAANASNPPEQNTNLLSSFWSHPATQNSNEISPFLRRMHYQLSAQISSAVSTSCGKSDEVRSSLNVSSLGTEVWRKLSIDPHTLTQWNANLRMWISQTILDRLVCEINSVNDEFQKFHLTDVRIGHVGLERLRKTAQTMPVVEYIPTLNALLPFLEISVNQEYLVKRLRDLAKGGCMSEFKWNSGGSYNGRQWDDSLVNDSELIIHLLATYLDCQLVPLPNQPDAKPFSKEHLVRCSEKVPVTQLSLIIHQVTEKPPHFRLIVGEEVYEVAKGHNNLFYTILLFLYFVSKKEHGMLGKVNMGRSGVNMLWIIEEE